MSRKILGSHFCCVVLTALVLIGLWIANQRFHFLPIASATQVSPILTLGAANENLTPETTQVPGATSTVEAPTNAPTATLTNIPTETQTIAPTLTPTETPTPTLAPWFYDDFTDGFDPKWARLSDDLVIVGGEVTFIGDNGDWMYITAPETPNYLIEFKVRFIRTNNWGLMVAPAFVDPENYYAFRSSWLSTHEWKLKKGAPPRTVGETSIIEMEEQLGTMTVQGLNVGVKLDSFEFNPIYNDQIEMGNIGFYLDSRTFLDEVRIILLP